MITPDKDLCVKAILADGAIPTKIKEHVDSLTEIEVHSIDRSYLDFLDEQIVLNARGGGWTERLRRRRDDLAAQIGNPLIRCALRLGDEYSTFEIDPQRPEIVHWEAYTT